MKPTFMQHLSLFSIATFPLLFESCLPYNVGSFGNNVDPSVRYTSQAKIQDQSRELTQSKQHNKPESILEKKLEQQLGFEIYGDVTIENLSVLESCVTEAKGTNLFSAVSELVFIPPEYFIDVFGLTYEKERTIKIISQTEMLYDLAGTIIHEVTHTYMSNLKNIKNSTFLAEWKATATPHYHGYGIEDSRLNELALHFIPNNGVISAYGFTNVREDIAEFVQQGYIASSFFSTVPKSDRPIFRARVDLLEKYNFFNHVRAEKIRTYMK